MKLADPRTVQANLTAQRKTDIDQGISLARKIDTLRAQMEDEEVKLTLFKEQTITEVTSQINEKIKERDTLLEEVKDLRKVHDHLSKLLDKEWGEVDVEKKQLEFLQKRIDGLQKQAEEDIKKATEELRSIEVEKKRQLDVKLQLEEQAELSATTYAQARRMLTEAHEEERRVSTQLDKTRTEIEEKESVLQATVSQIELQKLEIKGERKEIEEEKIRLADQRATLARAFARLQ